MGVMTAKPGVKEARAEAIKWIKDILAQKDWPASRLAEEAGLAPSTLLRLLNNPTHRYLPSFATIKAVSEAANVNITVSLMNAYGITRIADAGQAISPPTIRRNELSPKVAPPVVEAPRRSAIPPHKVKQPEDRSIPVKPVSLVPPELHMYATDKQVLCPRPMAGDKTAFAFYMADDAMSPFIPTKAMCYASKRRDPVDGDIVAAFKKNGHGMVRVLKETNEHGFLLADAKGNEATLAYDDFGDMAIVRIVEIQD